MGTRVHFPSPIVVVVVVCFSFFSFETSSRARNYVSDEIAWGFLEVKQGGGTELQKFLQKYWVFVVNLRDLIVES